MPERPAIPKDRETTLMFGNDHICCICRERGKDVQIHHIDGNKRNVEVLNLAVVCLDCHSRVTGRRGLGRRYTPEEVRKYKDDWESIVAKRRNAVLSSQVWEKTETSTLFEFEIKKLTYEFAATKDVARAQYLLEYLDVIRIFEAESEFIIARLHDLAPFYAGGQRAVMVAQYVLHHFWHLGPDRSDEISEGDVKAIEKTMELFDWMITFEAVARNTPAIRAILHSADELLEIARYYKKEELAEKISGQTDSILKKVQQETHSSGS